MNILDKVKQFTKELATYVAAGTPNVTPEQYEERLLTCNDCEHLNHIKSSCKLCGCHMPTKARWATADCPSKKWPKIEKES